jgi:hypothetical protein
MAGSWCAAFCAVHLVFGCLAGGSRRWHRRPARWAVSGAGAVDLVPTAPDLARPVGLARQVAGDPDPGRSSTSRRLLRAAVCGDLGLLPRSMVVGCRGSGPGTAASLMLRSGASAAVGGATTDAVYAGVGGRQRSPCRASVRLMWHGLPRELIGCRCSG